MTDLSSAVLPPLRVLAVTNMYPTPADPTYGAFVESQMESIKAHGHEVTIDFIDGRHGTWHYVWAVGHLSRLIRRERFDVIHAHYGLTGCVTAFLPLPSVVSFYGSDVLGSPDGLGGITFKGRVEQRLSTVAAWGAEEITCQSEGMRSALRRAHDRDRVHVIPSGVNTDRFTPGDRASARRRLRMDGDERLILFPSHSDVPRKRFDLANAAAERVRAHGYRVRLWVVEDVAPTDLPDYYRAADCMVLTSDWEGSPNVVKEAISCDVPVVSVDAGDVRQWIGLTPGCVLVERDVDDIARGIIEVLRGSGRVDGSGVRREAGIAAIADRIVALYRSAITQRVLRPARSDTASHSRS